MEVGFFSGRLGDNSWVVVDCSCVADQPQDRLSCSDCSETQARFKGNEFGSHPDKQSLFWKRFQMTSLSCSIGTVIMIPHYQDLDEGLAFLWW